MKKLSDAPIFICLSGDVYADRNKGLVGTVCGDPRMVSLEAFLDSLSHDIERTESKGPFSMSDAFRLLVKKCNPNILQANDVVVEVKSALNTEKKEMTHTFRITTQEKS
jgi:hypothetical protein